MAKKNKPNPFAEFGIRTEEELEEVYELAQEQIREGASNFHGMTYEDGIVAMIDWLKGDLEDMQNPMD